MNEPKSRISIFGVRHHGPGCARSLALALQESTPDIILVEGPPEADGLVALAGHVDLQPPVALLVYALENPAQASFYPFASFSPEWQALQYANQHQVPLRFFDLPASVRLAHNDAADAAGEADQVDAANAADATESGAAAEQAQLRHDPLDHYAHLAGFADGESWWDALIEQRQHGSAIFATVMQAMRSVREITPPLPTAKQLWEDRREAAMRQQIRAAQKEGYAHIAVVCGAWHAPALETLPTAKADQALLKDLKKCKVAATWVPWNYQRLSFASGYGAGIASPGWYDFLWQQQQSQGDIADQLAARWLTHVARLLRTQDFTASSAEVIDAVRLAQMLAQLNGRGQPGLEELNQAASSVLCMGQTTPLAVIRKELIIGDRLGQVPQETPAAPIARDLAALQKSLRMKVSALEQELDLDLRNDNDLARSHLLHRLNLLDIAWGKPLQSRGKKGSFHELWRLLWQPDFAISVIEAGRYGQTVAEAAQARALEMVTQATSLPQLTHCLQQVLLADLHTMLPALLQHLADVAAQSADVLHLLDALPPLASSLRYGSVRQFEQSAIAEIVAALLARIAIGLPNVCIQIKDDAAQELLQRIGAIELALATEQNQDYLATWRACLQQITSLQGGHPLLLGRCHRILLNAAELDSALLATRLGLALSHPQPEHAAAWIEGLLAGSGLLLLNDDTLWNLLNDWLQQLGSEEFVRVLPLLRRAFSQFAANERQMLGQRARQGGVVAIAAGHSMDLARAAAIVPLARQLLGLVEKMKA